MSDPEVLAAIEKLPQLERAAMVALAKTGRAPGVRELPGYSARERRAARKRIALALRLAGRSDLAGRCVSKGHQRLAAPSELCGMPVSLAPLPECPTASSAAR